MPRPPVSRAMKRAYGHQAERLVTFNRGCDNRNQHHETGKPFDMSADYADDPELLAAYRAGRFHEPWPDKPSAAVTPKAPFDVGDRVAWRMDDRDYVGAVERVDATAHGAAIVVVVDRRSSEDPQHETMGFTRRATGDYVAAGRPDGVLRRVDALSPTASARQG